MQSTEMYLVLSDPQHHLFSSRGMSVLICTVKIYMYTWTQFSFRFSIWMMIYKYKLPPLALSFPICETPTCATLSLTQTLGDNFIWDGIELEEQQHCLFPNCHFLSSKVETSCLS